MILAGVMIGFVLVGGLIYGTVGRTYFENQKIASIENRVDNFIENKYTNAIKDGVTVDQVSDIQKDIDNISDNSKKIRLQNKVQAIVTQAKLQSDLKAQIKKFSEAEKLEDISLEDLKNAISQAQGVLNVKVRNNLIKDGNDILDKVEYATYTLAEAQKMTGDNPGLYYTVEGLNESVSYPETKKEVDKLLEAGKTELDPEKRKEIYKQIQEIVRKDLPMYMIVYPLNNVVTKKDIKNFKLDPANSHRLYGVSIGE